MLFIKSKVFVVSLDFFCLRGSFTASYIPAILQTFSLGAFVHFHYV